MKTQKWFTDRIGKKIWNNTLGSSLVIIDNNHAKLSFKNQTKEAYKYSDNHKR